ncbi:hypothetical protein CVS47_02200 [Microbacterium lemovicicum]|uniref:Uncharacterized protein n=1 Tax=Microbacterium lemovicicum TaxID=1072463 RepID=A0A3Q9J3F2_9MICO|nr:hypothetical protein [Microbacterium lemovicicum]AZS37562.1 hypothetical protein CVS47_02200 [Microbacterium lemovicicum]
MSDLVYTSPLIRDLIVVDAEVERICTTYRGTGPVFLLAREVRLAQNLRITTCPLVIVADVFDGAGFTIDASGVAAPSSGRNGDDGVPLPMSQMYSPDGRPIAGGSSGQGGGAGLDGGNGQSVTIYARHTVNVSVTTAGGAASNGGSGGNGTAGASGAMIAEHTEQRDLTPGDPYDFEFEDVVIPEQIIPGTPGGNGGWGGNGGSGGSGGSVMLTSLSDGTEPVLAVAGGAAGGGGYGGSAGPDGAVCDAAASPGENGAPGAWGADGAVVRTTVSEEDFVAGLRPLLDSTGPSWANYWAPFRIAMGDWHYHRFTPSAAEPGDAGELAALELQRGLELQPDNGVALQLREQMVGVPRDGGDGARAWVGGAANAVGLSPQLDILPDFPTYIDAFQGFVPLASAFLFSGIDDVLQAGTKEALAGMVREQQKAVDLARDRFEKDVSIGTSERDIAAKEAEFIQQQLDQATTDITDAMAKMKDTPFRFGDIIGTVAAVAGAVAGVIAAIPTLGASLVAAVPAMVSLVSTVTAQAEPIAKALLAGTPADTKQVEEAYKKVGKSVDAVIGAGKTIVNFVTLVQNLTTAPGADNAEQIALVRRGAELAHQLLIAQNRVALADQRIAAAQSQAARAAELVQQAGALADGVQLDAAGVRQVGLLAIRIAGANAEALNSMAFRAARAVEILTLEPQAENIALDAGMLSPEVWQRYSEDAITPTELAGLLTASWGRMLQPIGMQQDYLAYFQQRHDQDVLTRIYRPADPEFRSLLSTGRFTFEVDAAALPSGRADAKTRSVRLALVGADHPSGGISCEVRHGGAYSQRRQSGEIDVQLLEPQISTRRAQFTRLTAENESIADVPLTAPLSLRFWGRGIGGEWGVSVVGAQENAGIDLSGLTEIQVEIRYQFVR